MAATGTNGNGPITVPAGLAGVVVADTTIGDVRGQEGFYHYRQYSAVELAASRSFEDVWHLLVEGQSHSSDQNSGGSRRSTSTMRSCGTNPCGCAPSYRRY